MSCEPSCIRPTPSQAHCPTCHRTFGGVRGFDDHRHNGTCLDPTTKGYVRSASGIWRTPMTEEYAARVQRMSTERRNSARGTRGTPEG